MSISFNFEHNSPMLSNHYVDLRLLLFLLRIEINCIYLNWSSMPYFAGYATWEEVNVFFMFPCIVFEAS